MAGYLKPLLPPSSASSVSSGSHIVKISGYSSSKLLPGGEHIKSTKFKSAGHSWRVLYYPNGTRNNPDGRIAIFLELADRKTDVRAKFQFRLVADDGEPAPATSPFMGIRHKVWFRSVARNRRWGLDLENRDELEKSEFIKDDSFLIRCEIAVKKKPVAHGLFYSFREVVCKRHYAIMKGVFGIKEALIKYLRAAV